MLFVLDVITKVSSANDEGGEGGLRSTKLEQDYQRLIDIFRKNFDCKIFEGKKPRTSKYQP